MIEYSDFPGFDDGEKEYIPPHRVTRVIIRHNFTRFSWRVSLFRISYTGTSRRVDNGGVWQHEIKSSSNFSRHWSGNRRMKNTPIVHSDVFFIIVSSGKKYGQYIIDFDSVPRPRVFISFHPQNI